MYRCDRCRGTFEHFHTAGQCPLCGLWASVRCTGCGHTASANVFISNGDTCPKCGASVASPGDGGGCAILLAAMLTAAGGLAAFVVAVAL
ncbi:MAG: hypothetical protein HYR84_03855 [Planctomycetes bacterium]|nr:hypothetical protein [Planctomycetota bacterium]